MFNNKIDMHSHFLPPSYMEYLKKYEEKRPDNFDTPSWSEKAHIKQMDALGVAFSFISISTPNLSNASDEIEKAYARRINEEGAAFVAKYPDRVALMAELPLPNIENALDEAAYALDVLGVAGFGLKTHYRGNYLGNSDLDPLLAFLDKHNAIVVVHPTKPFQHYEGVNEGLPIPTFEYFVETTRTFTNMVLKNTFEHYPNIRWVFPHAGAFIALLSDRFDSSVISFKLKNPLFHADFSGAMKHVYFDLAGFSLPKQIQILKQNVPIDHMLYGSDGPYTPEIATTALAGALEKTDQFSEQEKNMIFTYNAINLFPQLKESIGIDYRNDKTNAKHSSRKRSLTAFLYDLLLKNK